MRNKKKLLALILFLIMGFFMFTFANPSDGIDELTTPIEEENEEPSDEGKVEEPIKVANPIVAPVVNIDNAPVITVKPLAIKIVEGTEYDVMTGVTVTDDKDKDKDLVARSSITGVKDEQAGTLIITYKVTDSGNNTATATRTITILTKLGDEDEDHYTNEEETASKSDFDDEDKTPDYNYAPSIDLSECPTSMTVYDDVPNFSSCAKVNDEFYDSEGVKLTVDDSEVIINEAGEYTVSFTATDNLNNETFEELVLEVKKIDVVVTIDNKEKVYFDENETPTSDADTKAYKDHLIGVNLSANVNKYSNVGDYAITGDWTNKNYNVTFKNGNYKVNPKEVSAIWDDEIEYTYTGSKITPRVYAGSVDNENIITSLSINNNPVDVGDYIATASTTDSNYTLTNNTKTYKIVKANYGEYSIDRNTEYTYNGKKQDIETIGELSTDVTVSFVTKDGNGNQVDFKNAGTYDVVMNFICTNSNYNCPVSQNASLIINKTPLTVKANDATSVYGEGIADLSYKATGLVNNEELNESSVHLTTNATSTSVVENNYMTFVIVDSDNISKNYDIEYETGVYSITRASYDMSNISLNKDAKIYNGAIQSVSLNGSLPTGVKANFIYKIDNSEVEFKNADTYDVTVIFTCTDYNYECPSMPISEEITINKKDVEIKAVNASSNYGESIKNLQFETVGLYEPMDLNDVDLSTTATQSSNVGEYPISVSVKPTSTMLKNYNVTFKNGNYKVNPKEVSAIWDDEIEYTYTGSKITPRVYAGSVDNENIITSLSINNNPVDVGDYIATASTANSNYKLTNNTKTYKIIKANYDEYKIDKWARYTYNGKKQDIKTIGRLSTDVTVNFVTRNGNTFDFKNAGTYDVVMNFNCTNSNYNCPASQNAILIINKTPLTVKANDATSVYGETIAQLSYKATGLVNNEKLNEPSVHLTTNATSTSVVGNNYKTFVIVDSDNVSKNYDIKYETGVYSITRASYDISKISLNKDAKTYNGAIQSASLNGSLPAGVKANFKYMINNREVEFKTAGTYDVTVRLTCTDNNYYCPSKTISEKITINKKDATITAKSDFSNYGERIKNLTFEAVGLYEEMNSNDVVLSTTATNSSNAGEYPITVSVKPTSTMLKNYNFKTTNGIYTINKINYDISKIKIENVTVNYDSKTHNVKVSGLPSGVTASYTVNGNSFTGTSSVGTYNVTVNFTGDSNHNSIASKTGILTINNVQTGIRAEIKDNTQLQFQKNSSINISDYINVYRVYADGTEVNLSTYSTNLSTIVVGKKTLEITDETVKDSSLTYNIINEEAFQTKFEVLFTGEKEYRASDEYCKGYNWYGEYESCYDEINTEIIETDYNLLEVVEHYDEAVNIINVQALYTNNTTLGLKLSEDSVRWTHLIPTDWNFLGFPTNFDFYNPVYIATNSKTIVEEYEEDACDIYKKNGKCKSPYKVTKQRNIDVTEDVMDENNTISQVYITYTRESKNYMITFEYNPLTNKFSAIDEVQI